MTNITVYDYEAGQLEAYAEEKNITVAELVEAMWECFSENRGDEYLACYFKSE